MRKCDPRPATWAVLVALMIGAPVAVNAAPPAGAPAASSSSDNDAAFDNLEIVDPGLNGKLAVLRVGSEVGENKLLSVFAGFRNKTSRRLALEVETIYKDTEGNAINHGSWIGMTLKPHEEKEYRSSSISVEAIDFVIRVRRAAASDSLSRD